VVPLSPGPFSFFEPQATDYNGILYAFLVTLRFFRSLRKEIKQRKTAEPRPSALNVFNPDIFHCSVLFRVQSVIVLGEVIWLKVETYKFLPYFLTPTYIPLCHTYRTFDPNVHATYYSFFLCCIASILIPRPC
jgi:hypothetical protein